MLLINLDLLMQCEPSTISRQLKVRRILRVYFQQWSKKTEVFFAGLIKESEMMLEWFAEQATEITTTAIDLEFLPAVTNVERGVRNLEFWL